jgi:large subunit ribosomal protein L21
VDSIPAEVGSTVELGDVLLIASNGDVSVGRPTIEGARVIAEVIEHGRDRKIIVFKYKAKTRYRRRRGHRQGYTRLAVRQIVTAEGVIEAEETPKRRAAAKAAAKPARRARKAAPAAEAPAAEAPAVEAPPEAPEAEAKPARRARTRKPAAEAAPEATTAAPEAEAKPARRTRARKPAAEAPAATEKPKRTRKKTETE